MANWGVVLARRPVVRSKQAKKLATISHATTPSPMQSEKHEPYTTFRQHGHIFKHLCNMDDAHDCREMKCERITINVSGLQFITRRSILEAHPTTVLGDPDKRKYYYDHLREEYFFDRHRLTFESIFNYYLYGGKLKKPPSVADDVFLDECEFFEVEETVIQEYKREEGYTETKYEYPNNPILAKVWGLFEYPETSRLAFIIGIISVLATLISIVTFTLETIPDFKPPCNRTLANQSSSDVPFTFNSTTSSVLWANITMLPNTSITVGPSDRDPPDPWAKAKRTENFFFAVETICNIWFTVEAVVRFISCPNHIRFWKDIKNIIDIVAIVPYYVSLVQRYFFTADQACAAGNDFAFLRVIRLIRVFKLTKHSQGLQILLLTFQSSIEGLTLFVLTLMVCVLVFSSMLYYCELGEKGTMIKSIPGGFWWAVITMCTVGYGDVYPVGTYGKLVGTVCAISGVLTLAIPVPIITENFNKFYVHKTRSKPKDFSKPTLLQKAHKQLVKVTKCCQERVDCKKDSTNCKREHSDNVNAIDRIDQNSI